MRALALSPTHRPVLRLLLAAATVATLAGCADPAPTYYQAFGFRCEDKKSHTAAVLCNKTNDPGAAKVSRYCYKTLGDTTCYDRPDPDRKNQPQGSPG